jgi:hypothetical protein
MENSLLQLNKVKAALEVRLSVLSNATPAYQQVRADLLRVNRQIMAIATGCRQFPNLNF